MIASMIVSLCVRFSFGAGPSRNAAIRRVRGAVLGIALSLVPLVLVLEVANGMIEGISSRFIETWSSHVQLVGPSSDDPAALEAIAGKVVAAGLAVQAFPEVQGLGLLKGSTAASGATIRAVSPAMWDGDAGFRSYMKMRAGEFSLQQPNDMVVGIALAQKLGISVGDRVRLLTYRSESWAGLPKVSTFMVRGIVGSGYQELDRYWLFIPLERGMRIIDPASARTTINCKVTDAFELPNPLVNRGGIIHPQGTSAKALAWAEYAEALEEQSGRQWFPLSWYESQESQFEHFLGTKNILLFVMVLIVLVATLNVLSSMILLVFEKQHDIAMLKSMGAGPSDVARVFLLIGGLAGASGAVLGIGMGSLLSQFINELIYVMEMMINLFARLAFMVGHGFVEQGFQKLELLNPEFYLERIPVRVHVNDLLFIAMLTVSLSFLASWVPARKASQLKPIDILRKV